MKLMLDRLDLHEEYENINCSQTKFKHFSMRAQIAIRAVGKATFRYDGSNYNVVYAPKEEKAVRFLYRAAA